MPPLALPLCLCWLVWYHPLVLPLCMCGLVWCHPIALRATYVLVGVVPPPGAARYARAGLDGATPLFCPYVCAGWCDATPLCYALSMCWLVLYHPIMLPTTYVLVTPCVARYVCAGWCGATPLCCPQCMCWLVWCHPLLLPAMYVLVAVVPTPCVAR